MKTASAGDRQMIPFLGREPRFIGWLPCCDPVPVTWLSCRCGARFPRAAGETCTERRPRCLGCELTAALRSAAFTHASPELAQIRQWNADARQRAGIAEERAA